jgi:hypothetical protein
MNIVDMDMLQKLRKVLYILKIGQTYELGIVFHYIAYIAINDGLFKKSDAVHGFVPVKVGSLTVPTVVGNFDATEDYTFNFAYF